VVAASPEVVQQEVAEEAVGAIDTVVASAEVGAATKATETEEVVTIRAAEAALAAVEAVAVVAAAAVADVSREYALPGFNAWCIFCRARCVCLWQVRLHHSLLKECYVAHHASVMQQTHPDATKL